MFDLRYHVASLVAVFVALVIGIVVGVGISGRGLVRESERRNLEAKIARLERELNAARLDRDEVRAAQEYEQQTYETVMEGRLRDRTVAVVYVGPVNAVVRANVEETLDLSGGAMERFRVLKVPIKPEELQARLADDPDAPRDLRDLGRALGEELVVGGDAPLWEAIGPRLVQQRLGGMQRAVDGVVVARTVEPQRGPTARFLAGLYTGLAASGVPAVAVETSDANPSAVDVFDRYGFSSVDNVETTPGRVSLAVLLAGGVRGHYGIKPTRDDYIPRVEPVPPAR